MSKVAVFLYDLTGLMAEPWLSAGYTCFSFDMQHPAGLTVEGLHTKVGMTFDPADIPSTLLKIIAITGPNCSFLFGFPDCTHLTVTGAKHWASKSSEDRHFQTKAIRLADLVRRLGDLYDCPWAFENPKGRLNTFYRKPDYSFDPYEYGDYLPPDDKHPLYPRIFPPQDAYYKETCIWAGNNFRMPDRRPVPPLYADSPGQALLGGKSQRTKNIRSCTPRGFAQAVFLYNADYSWESLL